MEAGPRDTARGTEYGADRDGVRLSIDPDADHGVEPELGEERLSSDGPEDTPGGVIADGPGPGEMSPEPEVEVELRPQRLLRIWQLPPIVALGATGSLTLAF